VRKEGGKEEEEEEGEEGMGIGRGIFEGRRRVRLG